MPDATRCALIGDVHLYTLRVAARSLVSKRVLGQTNLWLNRRKRFRHDLLPDLVARLKEAEPAWVLSPGDVTTSSLTSEFQAVASALSPLCGSPQTPHESDPQTVITPGNHDRYTFRASRTRRMESVLPAWLPDHFPHRVPLNGAWTLLALDSGVPNVWSSRGRLGPTQMAALTDAVEACTVGRGLVVLTHYPCVVPAGTPRAWSHDLAEHREVHETLQRAAGTVIYVHGHVHRPWCLPPATSTADGRRFGFTSLNCGSPCMRTKAHPLGQGVWTLELGDGGSDWRAEHHWLAGEPSTAGKSGKSGATHAADQEAGRLSWHTRSFGSDSQDQMHR